MSCAWRNDNAPPPFPRIHDGASKEAPHRPSRSSFSAEAHVGIRRAQSPYVDHFDRDIHDVDVIEHVFRGVQLLCEQQTTSSSDVASPDVPAWLAGTAITAVQVTVMDDEPDEGGAHASLPKRSR